MTQFDAHRERIRLLAPYDDRWSLWAAETTVDMRDPHPGIVVPDDDNQGSITWRPTGTYEVGSPDVHLHVRDAGYPGLRATYLHSADGTTKHGWDAPSRVTDVGFVEWTSILIPRNSLFDLATAGDGTLVCVTDYAASNNGTQLRVHARSVDAGEATWSTLSGQVADPSTTNGDNYPAGYAARPCLVNVQGQLFLFVQRHLAEGYQFSTLKATQVDVYRARADADWTGSQPFELETSDALDNAYAYSSGGPGHMCAAVVGSQVMLLMRGAGTDINQYASVDGGGDLASIGTLIGDGAAFALTASGGSFVVASYNGDDELVVRVVADATARLSDTVSVLVSSDASLVATSPPTFLAEPSGRLWLYAQLAGVIAAWVSDDHGATWSSEPVSVSHSGETDGLSYLAATWWRGRGVLLHTTEHCSGYSQSLACLDLGGWGTHTLPIARGAPGDRVTWRSIWTPREDPADATDQFDLTAVGTPTQAWNSAGEWVVTCGGSDTLAIAPEGTLAHTSNSRCWETCVAVDSGSAQVFVSSQTMHIRVVVTSSSLTVKDGDGTTIATVYGAFDELTVISVSMHTTSATGSVRYRSAGSRDAQAWTVAYSGSLTPIASYLLTKFQVDSDSVVRLRSNAYAQPGPSYTWAPAEPYGRPISPLPLWTTNGLAFAGMRGPGVAGDVFTCSATSRHGVARAAYTPAYPSPRQLFQSATATPGDAIAYRLNETGNTARGWPFWFFYFVGNVETVRVDWYVSGAWVTGPVVRTSYAVEMAVAGISATPDEQAADSVFVEEDELAGGYIDPGSSIVRIESNTSGCLHGEDGSGKVWTKAALQIEDGHNNESTTKIWFPRSAAMLDSSDVPDFFQGYRIVLLGDEPPEGRWHVKHALWPAYPLVQSHGRDTLRTYTPQREETAAENGMRVSRQVAPMENELTLSWQNSVDIFVRQTVAGTAPDYFADANGVPAQARGEMSTRMRAIFERVGAKGWPVGYVPRFDVLDGSAEFYRNRAGGTIVGTLEGGWSVDDVGSGDEMHTVVKRLGQARIKELQ